jgi:hypothetical protein
VVSIGAGAFAECRNLSAIYFKGNAPEYGGGAFGTDFIDWEDPDFVIPVGAQPVIYYLSGTSGWLPVMANRRSALWNPVAQTTDAEFGIREHKFGFNIIWPAEGIVVVEACADLANPNWTALATNRVAAGSVYFSDPEWTNHPARIYRLRSL